MCTATWWSDAGRYELFFSRDERRDRSLGLYPEKHVRKGIKYLCPRDPDGGGTWLLVNEFGLTVCLLNEYPEKPPPTLPPRISRGQLVEAMADCSGPEAIEERLRATDLGHYEGFLMLAVSIKQSGQFRWNSHDLETGELKELQQPVTSSSFMSDEVLVTRQHLFAEMVAGQDDPSPEKLDAFHRHFMPDASTHSAFMQRDDSETVSLCQVGVSESKVGLSYAPKHPEEPRFLESVRLTLPLKSNA